MDLEILIAVRQAAAKKMLFLSHALEQMNSPERLISTKDVRQVIDNGEIIEDYPEDPRGHSCLLFGLRENRRPIHVVCSPKIDYLAVITAYVPEKHLWTEDFRHRR